MRCFTSRAYNDVVRTPSHDDNETIYQHPQIAFVYEPSLAPDGKLKTRRKGVGHFDIRVRGVSSHAGIEPEKGRSAILELSHVIQKLFELNDAGHGVSVNVGTIDGGISTNVVATESTTSVDVRVFTKQETERIENEIKSIKPCSALH